MPDQHLSFSLRRWRRPGAAVRPRARRRAPRTPLGHQVISPMATALLVLASAVVTVALGGGPSATVALAADSGPCGSTGVLTSPTSCAYTTVGSDTFTVPAGVSAVDVVAVGGQGGHFFIAGDAAHGGSPAGDLTGSPGGAGGKAVGTLPVTGGAVLQVDVVGKGPNATAASRSGGMMNGPCGGVGADGGFGGSSNGGSLLLGDAPGAHVRVRPHLQSGVRADVQRLRRVVTVVI
jgi:hypothetical protein